MMPKGFPRKGEEAGRQYSNQTGTQVGFEYDEQLPPWQIQPGESDDAFGAFVVYRDLGPRRTLLKAGERYAEADPEHGLRSKADTSRRCEALRRTFAEWSAKFDWVRRCRAFDAYVDAENVKARIDAQRDAVIAAQQLHAQLSRSILVLGGRGLQEILGPEGLARIKDMSPSDLMMLVQKGIILDRLVLGIDSQRDADDQNARINGQPRLDRDELKRMAIEAAIEARREEPDDPEILPPQKPETNPDAVVDNDPETE